MFGRRTPQPLRNKAQGGRQVLALKGPNTGLCETNPPQEVQANYSRPFPKCDFAVRSTGEPNVALASFLLSVSVCVEPLESQGTFLVF